MKTRAIALVALLCSGAAYAQDPLGDDNGPNAHDGRCDDSRFENIGAGNSNIVFWEGGRYDGRDATDCRDLLLRGLINWRDGVDPRVDEVLATGEFGDDGGPNAHDGQCDDTRFENIGAGNSNIVFWEGGRYDGRDATDCADLLLHGLIAWRRDTAVAGAAGVPEEQQRPQIALPEAVTAESICSDNPEEACWMELINVPDCYIWNPHQYGRELKIDTWSGQCANGLGTGTVVFALGDERGSYFLEVPYINGERHGTEVLRGADGFVAEIPYINGERHGTEVHRGADGFMAEIPYSNGEKHGTEIIRFSNGNVHENPYVNGVLHGTQIQRRPSGRVEEIPYVNGVIHGTWTIQFDPDNVRAVEEIPLVNGELHGTQIARYKDGRVWETVWVNGDIESQGCTAGCE